MAKKMNYSFKPLGLVWPLLRPTRYSDSDEIYSLVEDTEQAFIDSLTHSKILDTSLFLVNTPMFLRI